MIIDIVGDLHGDFFYLRKWASATNADLIIQAGDFGIMPKCGLQLDPYRPFETDTFFIPGNHDDHDWLSNPSRVLKELPGGLGYLGRISERQIDGLQFAFLGGGYSIDRHARVEGVNWWSNEQPTKEEVEQFSEYRPDIAITHEGPTEVLAHMFGKDILNATAKNLNNMVKIVDEFRPKLWFFGHHHPNKMTFWDEWGITFVCLPIFRAERHQVFTLDTSVSYEDNLCENFNGVYGINQEYL